MAGPIYTGFGMLLLERIKSNFVRSLLVLVTDYWRILYHEYARYYGLRNDVPLRPIIGDLSERLVFVVCDAHDSFLCFLFVILCRPCFTARKDF